MNRSTIHTPASLDEADQRLGDIERVLMARGWERAAILATVVRLPGKGKNRNSGSSTVTCEQYAERRIPGLLDDSVIRLYVQRWLDANDGSYPSLDSDVTLPARKWPPVDKSDSGSRPTPTNIARQLDQNPALAQAAAQGLADGAIRHVEKQTNRDLSRAVDEKITHDYGVKPKPKPKPRDDGQPGDEFWAEARKALYFLLDVQVKIAQGATPPADVAILMQILVPRDDWDEAASDLIGDHR